MKKFLMLYLSLLLLSCAVTKPQFVINRNYVESILRILSSDEMQGREIFSPGIEKAAQFIEKEFKDIGLDPLPGLNGLRQELSMFSIKPSSVELKINGSAIENEKVLVITDKADLTWLKPGDAEVQYIKSGDSFMSRFQTIRRMDKPVIVFVDEEFTDAFNKVRKYFTGERILSEIDPENAAVFVLGAENTSAYQLKFINSVKKAPLYNIAGIIPGKSKAHEYVIFSAHYDHIGILESESGDSIANGADDNASGVAAILSLARHYKKLKNNERTLIFVAFTGEESGMHGSKHFSRNLDPDKIVAMFNIEMIGKQSKFGKNSAFITGFEKSDFANVLQRNVQQSGFTFHPDPYPEQQLFYRSDNATLAALGVPAHTISTSQIDTDKFYHSVDDEFETLDLENIISTINGIALGSAGIVSGDDTPNRIIPLSNERK